MSKETANVLKKAASLLVEVGWIQGRYGDSSTGYCSYGAIDEVTQHPDQQSNCRQALLRAAGMTGIEFNDAKGRTKEQVLKMFAKAINSERQLK